MRIAIGSDHRGAKVAKSLTADVFFRNHYGDENPLHNVDELPGAYLIEGVDVSETFDEESRGERENFARITPLSYSGALEKLVIDLKDPPRSVDYPDAAAAVAEAVSDGRADYGVLICGTGVGMCITANKFRGVRAALCSNLVVAELSRRHNNANVLCLSGEFLGLTAIESIVRVWLTTPFDGGRHQRRLDLIAEIERETGL